MKFDRKVYAPSDIEDVLKKALDGVKTVKKRKAEYEVYNVPCAFDTEASSFICNGEKVGLVYCWTFGINGYVIFGRSLKEYKDMMGKIKEVLQLGSDKRLPIYVHNLAYDFQFIRKYLKFGDVFSLETHKPLRAVTENECFEFRCSYLLTGYNLDTVAKNLLSHKVKKLVGNLDYDLVRTPVTPMTKKEIEYCVNDVKVVMACIAEKIDQDGDIEKIPMTSTGYVRKYCRNMCYNKENYRDYRFLIENLTIESDEYDLLKEAFAGGFTHANYKHSGETLLKVSSYDETSAYPSVMVLEKYPMSKGAPVTIRTVEEFNNMKKYYCLVMEVMIKNLESISNSDHPISLSKCKYHKNAEIDNGRIIRADEIIISMTDIDFDTYKMFYNYGKVSIGKAYAYKRGRLPRALVKAILGLYKNKTELKGIAGKELEYQQSKGMLNSTYGASVEDVIRDEINYELDAWDSHSVTLGEKEEQIKKYNESKNRFLFYPWGVYVTAYARRNILYAVKACGEDYVYSDTDSCKILNNDKHKGFFEQYNKMIDAKIQEASTFYNIPIEYFSPKTKKGKVKTIGYFDYEGEYEVFKTLGAKRYIYIEKNSKVPGDSDLHITIAGISKKFGAKYLSRDGKYIAFKYFNDGLHVPGEYSGKLTHTYVDEERIGVVTDYLGNSYQFVSPSSVHMEKATYNLSMSGEYLDLIGRQCNKIGVRNTGKNIV